MRLGFLCLIFNARENDLFTVSSALMLGLSRMELSNFPMPTHCLQVALTLNKVRGLPPPMNLLSNPAPLHLGSDPKPFALTSFLSTIPRSDSWHRIGWNFACAYIHTYFPAAAGRCLCSPFPTLSSVGATISRPYLPFRRYQASLGHTCLFPTVSPANTLVRWAGTLCLRLHSAGSTIAHLWPTGSSSGWLPSITTRWFSSNPSDLTSR